MRWECLPPAFILTLAEWSMVLIFAAAWALRRDMRA